MMNPLLQRQIRKLLDHTDAQQREELQPFLEAIDQSYDNYEEQMQMVRRAMVISSKELEEANKQLRKETSRQQEVIKSLSDTINTLRKYANSSGSEHDATYDGIALAKLIEDQTQQLIKTNKERDMLLKDLERRNKELGDYAHVVSHDLKAPLRGIDALVNFLKEDYEEVFDESGKENLEGIRKLLVRMDNLITGILEYAEISNTQESMQMVRLDALLEDIVGSTYQPGHIKIEVMPLPVVKGNALRFRQVFQNLIQNAIGAMDKAEGLISIQVKDHKGMHCFSVADNGKGINEKYHDMIFEKFRKLENKPDSSGIGLPIVEKIVNHYGGEIWLKSQEGVGTTFYFTLPKN
ncbi:MAG: two-component sensor histidine kinase [Cytophagaceae bacterium]|nr:two-component sensor histidine kinase [Cytophagaceae bacterium]|tara:strand:- start:157 stop:1209 length:1053 start_codon:yes stop_codon:yes gene_type:complete